MLRVSGDWVCRVCGRLYYEHPDETRVLDRDGHCFLTRLCDGTLGKL